MEKKNNKKIIIGVAFALACEFLYGISYIFTKSATEDVSMLTLLGWRFLIAFIGMTILVLVGVMKVSFKGKNLKYLLIIAVIDPVIYFVAETYGISWTTASESGTFLAAIPVASLIASTLYLKKKPTRLQTLGICITLGGVLVTVLGVGVEASFSPAGYLMLLLAVVSYSVYSVLVEDATDFSGADITYAMIVVAFIVFGTGALVEAGVNGTMHELLTAPMVHDGLLKAMLYQGIGCSILAVFMSNVAISYIGVNRVSTFFGLSVVISILSGVFILGEGFTMVQIIGAAVILGGVYTANLGSKE